MVYCLNADCVFAYQTLAEVPEWGRKTIAKLIENGKFADKNKLNLSEDMIRTFVILDR